MNLYSNRGPVVCFCFYIPALFCSSWCLTKSFFLMEVFHGSSVSIDADVSILAWPVVDCGPHWNTTLCGLRASESCGKFWTDTDHGRTGCTHFTLFTPTAVLHRAFERLSKSTILVTFVNSRHHSGPTVHGVVFFPAQAVWRCDDLSQFCEGNGEKLPVLKFFAWTSFRRKNQFT